MPRCTWNRADLLVPMAMTLAAIATIYAPQPLLPLLAGEFHLELATAALAVTATLLPLAAGPLLYGYLLESVSTKKTMVVSLAVLAATQAGLAWADSFGVFLALRFVQGLAVPALLTALMTHVAASATPERVHAVMATYIAVTTLGGFSGRFFSGLAAAQWGRRAPFAVLAALLCGCLVLARMLSADARTTFVKPSPRVIGQVLARPGFLKAYLMAACLFFVFTGMLNILPFRLTEIEGPVSSARIGVMYLGYLVGIAASLWSPRAARPLGGRKAVLAVGLAVESVSVLVFAVPAAWAIFVSVVILCGGMFLTHAAAPGILNAAAPRQRGVVNGLYLAFYYSGGVLGSYLPGLARDMLGFWSAVVLLFAVALCALGLAASLGHGLFDGHRPESPA
ncbi:MFS transporter [Desulfolutivibrio sp.]|uniref:MFS transporter n=1 Tax=Desulfolutivibrio sp. TaxID=2773296 RepID=UPI002F96ADDE